jgi:hypothetical protein
MVSVECVPTTKLNKPKFCNYNAASSILIEGVNSTNVVEKAKYTNCYDDDTTNVIETSC